MHAKNMKKDVVASYIHSELNPASDFIFPHLSGLGRPCRKCVWIFYADEGRKFSGEFN